MPASAASKPSVTVAQTFDAADDVHGASGLSPPEAKIKAGSFLSPSQNRSVLQLQLLCLTSVCMQMIDSLLHDLEPQLTICYC